MECPNCDRDGLTHLSTHWAGSKCEYPKLSEEQEKIVTGVLMGDGNIHIKEGRNPSLRINITRREYVEYLSNKFDIMSCNITTTDTDNKNHSRIYSWRTRNTPQLSKFADWYNSGEKVFPSDIDLTPTVLKHWYVCDGNYNNSNQQRRIRISMLNEKDEKDKIESYFSKSCDINNFYWDESSNRCDLVFNVDTTEQLFNYMGEPLPGFKYKWPN